MHTKVKISRQNLDMHFSGVNASGNTIQMDGSSSDESLGTSPMELILMAIGGCSGIDVQHILKKQRQHADTLDIEIDGQREKLETYSAYTQIDVLFKMTGNVDAEKAIKAVDLSMQQYCSVSKLVEQACPINYRVELNSEIIHSVENSSVD